MSRARLYRLLRTGWESVLVIDLLIDLNRRLLHITVFDRADEWLSSCGFLLFGATLVLLNGEVQAELFPGRQMLMSRTMTVVFGVLFLLFGLTPLFSMFGLTTFPPHRSAGLPG